MCFISILHDSLGPFHMWKTKFSTVTFRLIISSPPSIGTRLSHLHMSRTSWKLINNPSTCQEGQTGAGGSRDQLIEEKHGGGGGGGVREK